MHIGSKTEYARKYLGDRGDKTTRTIEMPWVGTAEIARRQRYDCSDPENSHWVPFFVPDKIEETLAKRDHNGRCYIGFYPLEGYEAIPYHSTLWIEEIVTYVSCPYTIETSLYLRRSEAVVTIADSYDLCAPFNRVEHGMGVTSLRLGDPLVVPPRQPIQAHIELEGHAADAVAEALKASGDEETSGKTFIMGIKVIGHYSIRNHLKGMDDI